MTQNLRTEWVGTNDRQQLVERNNGLVEEVKMLRQHVADMYRAWVAQIAPPPPPPSFLKSVLTRTPSTRPDAPPHSPYITAYHSLPSHPSSSITRPPAMFSQCFSPPQHNFSPRDPKNHTSLSRYPAPQNAYPPSQAYRKPSGSGFRPCQACKNDRWLKKRKAFTPIGGSYAGLFQKLKQLDMLKPIHINAPNPLSKKLDFSKRCAYCSDTPGHDIEKCWRLKEAIQKLIDAGDIVVQNPDATDTSQSPSPIRSEMHRSNMICFEKEYENSSEILGGPRMAKFSVLYFGGDPSKVDAEFSG